MTQIIPSAGKRREQRLLLNCAHFGGTSPVITESVFNELIEHTFEALEEALDQIDTDIDYQMSSSTLPVRRPSSSDGQDAGHCLPHTFYTSDPQSWIPAHGRGDWCSNSNTDPAPWLGSQPQCTFSQVSASYLLTSEEFSLKPHATALLHSANALTLKSR